MCCSGWVPPAGFVTELSVRAVHRCAGWRGGELLDSGDGVGGDVDVEVGLVGVLVVGDAEGEGVAQLAEQVVGHLGEIEGGLRQVLDEIECVGWLGWGGVL